MALRPVPPPKSNTPCGKRLIEACRRSPIFKRACQHFHIDQIAHDALLMWGEANTARERSLAWSWYRRELRSALLWGLALDGLHGAAIHQAVAAPEMGMWAFIFAYLILYFLAKR